LCTRTFATMALLVCSAGKFILVLCTLHYLLDLLAGGPNSMHESIKPRFLLSNWAQLLDEIRRTDLSTQQVIAVSNTVSNNTMLN
jgi:hypothetical protein